MVALALMGSGCLAACTEEAIEPEPDPIESSSSEIKTGKGSKLLNGLPFPNATGLHSTLSTRDGLFLDTNNAFFTPLGTNGRACVTCHAVEDGFSVSGANIRKRFKATKGTDPIFRPVDGANNPNANTSTLAARQQAYSLLLNQGVIRIQLAIPAGAQFEVIAVDDPNGNDISQGLSLFRRPLPSVNLKFSPLVMFDAREPDLISQARNATLSHAEASASPSDEDLQEIVDFETGLFTTQVHVNGAGPTFVSGAHGDPYTLAIQPFAVHQNRNPNVPNPVGLLPGTNVFTIYDGWTNSNVATRKAIARGQAIFNTKQFFDPAAGMVACANCHNSSNSGSFSADLTSFAPPPAPPGAPFGGFPTVAVSQARFRTPSMPLYTLRNIGTGETRQTTDPGMALRTGLWRDVDRFKTPQLRGLASHAPYFHNGIADTLEDVVTHYEEVFAFPQGPLVLTAQEKSDLVAFLGSL